MYGRAGDNLGSSVVGVGDINGDGIDDYCIGAPFSDNQVGAAFVIYGRAGGSPDIYLSAFNHKQGFAIFGAASSGLFGYAVSGVGDMSYCYS